MKSYQLDEQIFSQGHDLFISSLCVIPSHYTKLSLSNFKLYAIDSYTLYRAFSSIPYSITEVDLSLNSLFLKTVDELKEALGGFPENVKTVILRSNGFNKFSEQDLAAIISSMPFVYEVVIHEKGMSPEENELLATRLNSQKNVRIKTCHPSSLFFRPISDEKACNVTHMEKNSSFGQ